MSDVVRRAALTDVGAVRELNEDAVLADGALFAVADGMGGHAAGEVASAMALDVLRRRTPSTPQPEDVLDAIAEANAAIVGHARRHPETAGMGTTLAGLCLGEVGGSPHWFVFNVGDSRVYRFVDGELARLTTDHSEVAELVALGHITEAEAKVHPLRNVVTRSLGTDPAPVVDIWVRPAVGGETFLVCSDGLVNEVDDSAIRSVLAFARSVEDAASELIGQALAAGARDNVSVVLVGLPHTSSVVPESEVTAPRPVVEQ